MSAANTAALSAMPFSRWNRVPAAGMRPAESAVEPDGTSSRSMTTASIPASFAASAAHRPAAPAPTMTSGTRMSKSSVAETTTTALIVLSDHDVIFREVTQARGSYHCFGQWHREKKCGSSTLAILSPYLAAVCFHDRPGYRQAEAGALSLRRVKGIENLGELVRRNTNS